MPNEKRWQELCEQASKEQDSKKLEALIEEILQMLHKNRNRLRKPGDPAKES